MIFIPSSANALHIIHTTIIIFPFVPDSFLFRSVLFFLLFFYCNLIEKKRKKKTCWKKNEKLELKKRKKFNSSYSFIFFLLYNQLNFRATL